MSPDTAARQMAATQSCLRLLARRVIRAVTPLLAFVALLALGSTPAAAQFVQGGDLVPGPTAQFPLWGAIGAPRSGVVQVNDGRDYSVSQPNSNYARIWMAIGTQNGGMEVVSPSNLMQFLYIRIDHKGTPEEPTNFNIQLNLGGAPAGRVDHLLSIRPIFSGPSQPLTGRVRIALKRYATDANGVYPLLGAFTTGSFAATVADNIGSPAQGEAIGYEGVASDGLNGFELRIPVAWFSGDPTRLVNADGTGKSSSATAFFTSGGSFGAVATVRDWLADANGNSVQINLSNYTGAHAPVAGSKLAFTVQPAASTPAYQTLPPVSVEIRNADDTRTVGVTNAVTVQVASGPGTVSGTTTVNAVDGTATFNALQFTVAGTYTLRATSTALLDAVSTSFTITAIAPTAPTITGITPASGQLSVAFTPSSSDGGAPITTYQYSLDAGAWVTRATGTTASPLVITGLTNGVTYAVRIRAVNSQGGGAASNSMSGAPFASVPPSNTSAPTISGTTQEGQTLTANPGTWAGDPAPTLAYQWRRCDAAGANCSDIAGATALTHVLGSADVGQTLRVVVTGTNAWGTSSASSVQTAMVSAAPSAPANSTPPAITGTTTVGQTLSVTPGTWTGVPTPTVTYHWRRCDAAGATCADIAGATATTYPLVAADEGRTIRVVETGTNTAGTASATSAQTAVIAAPPANTVLPVIGGTAEEGQVLTASSGTWTGTPVPTYTYQWRRCDASGASCADIAGATASTYTAVGADVNATLRVVVTGTNTVGTASATSAQTGAITPAPAAPANTSAPTITGTTTVGQALTANPGTWTGVPSPVLTYQWRRCDASGASCVDIAGATATTYTLGTADAGRTIRVVETGANASGSASAGSSQTAVITAPPSNSAPPTITGTTTVGQALGVVAGTWTGVPAPALTYQWRRCDASGAGCVDIAGATATTYTLTNADEARTLRVVETGTSTEGSTSATSSATAVVAAPPANTIAPAITGMAQEGQVLTANPGSWSGTPTPTHTYVWRRCDESGNACANIAGATGSSHTATAADIGFTLRVVVTGTNSAGSAVATSSSTGTVAAAPAAPVNSGVPTISGVMTVGETVTVIAGSWTGNPTPTLSYQWRRCEADGSACIDIAGATATAYTLVAADEGGTVRVVETGTNTAGTSSATSVQSDVVAAPPANTVAPVITGTTQAGQILTTSPGTWTGTPTPSLTYQWRRCDESGSACADIDAATASTYTLVAADVGRTVRAVVTGTNSLGVATATSAQSATIASAPAAPANTSPATITGTAAVGQLLTANAGSWTGTPAPSLTYQWRRCDASGANCANIAGATTSTYTLTPADAGTTIRVAETGTNASGTTTVSSAQTAVVTAPPANTSAPTIAGTAQAGQTLTANPGTWTGTPTPALSYQWRRCDAGGNACVSIAGATAATYVLAGADVGATIRVVVTGTNGSGSASATSNQTTTIAAAPAAPVSTGAPTITGTTTVGQVLTVTAGTWTGNPAPTLTYQWRRCDAAGTACANIAGATATTYTLVAADEGRTLRVVETGSNASGNASATSAQTAVVAAATTSPSNTVLPTISGTPAVGEVLTADPGTWSGNPAPSLTYQWRRCAADGTNCVDIAGATASTYLLRSADAGATIRVAVTGSNGSGTTTVGSAAAGPVGPAAPSATRSRVYTVATDSTTADSVPAGGNRFALVRIELRDASGSLLGGRAGSLAVSIDGAATATTVRETTTPGVYEFELRSATPTVATVTVTIDSIVLQDRPRVTFVATGQPDLAISLAVSDDTPTVGQSVVVTVEVRNQGTSAATGVEVAHPLGDRVRLVTASATRGAYDATRGMWTVGSLAAGESAVLTVTVVITK